jgi:hypothetical protein
MQAIAPVTVEDLLGPVKEMLYKLEIWDGASWINLNSLNGKHYLKKVSLKLGGAGTSPDPVAGSWSAEVSNPDGIFHPFHPTSSYAGLFRVGRKVRISVGAKYAGTPYYWQRLIGYMNAPTFNHAARTVTLKGADFMKRLADTIIRASPLDQETVNGPSHWGARAVFNSLASYTPTGAELYTYGDALDPVTDTETIDPNWEMSLNSNFVANSSGEPPPPSYAAKFSINTGSTGWVKTPAACSLTKDKRYLVKFNYIRPLAATYKIELAQVVGGTRTVLASWSWSTINAEWATKEMTIGKAPATGNLEFRIDGSGMSTSSYLQLGYISIKECEEFWYRYPMPEGCNGPYWVTLDGEPILQGDAVKDDGSGGGWFYDENTNNFYFDEKKSVLAGTANLKVYYYTMQNLDNVLADLLVAAGYYANRAAALAAMNYTPTEVTIPRAWFNPGSIALAAVKLICERVNYRFWFAYGGTPCFKPAPTATSPVFTFSLPGQVKDPGVHQDLAEIRNRIVIEGIERAMFATREEKKESRLSGEAFDQTSIDTYLEKTHPITNHLFQDQPSLDAMATVLLAAFKDPKWYTDIKTPFNPVPLELGDTVTWPVELAVAPAPGEEPVIVELAGIVRDIDISGSEIFYKCEITTAGEMEAHALLSLLHIDTEAAAPLLGDMVLASGEQPAEIAGADPEHELLSERHPDTVPASPLAADVIAASGDPVRWRRLPAGSEGQVLKIVGGAPAWGAGGVDTFLELTDVDEPDYVGHEGEFVKVNATADGLEFGVGGGGAAAFLDLTDVDEADYIGHEGQVVRVNAAEDGLEFGVIDAACLWETDDSGIHNLGFVDQLFLLDVYAEHPYQARKISRVDGTLIDTVELQDANNAVDMCSDGTYIYLGNISDCKIYKYLVSDLSLVAVSATTLGSGNNQFNYPYGICTDGSYLYIIDINNYRWVKMRCSDLVWLSAYGEYGAEDDWDFILMRYIATDGVSVWITCPYGGGDSATGISRWTVGGGFVARSTARYGVPPNFFAIPTRITTDGSYLYYADITAGGTKYIVKRTLAMAYVDSVAAGGDYGIVSDGEFLYASTYWETPTYGCDVRKYALDLTLLNTWQVYSFPGGCITAGIAIPPAFGNVGIGRESDSAYRLSIHGSMQIDGQIVSTLADGTAPLVVTSTTLVANLNADLLDGNHAAAFAAGGHGHDVPTGTGFRHVVAGVEDAAAKLVANDDVDVAAAITESKLDLDYPTHDDALDHAQEHDILSADHGDALAGAVEAGDLIRGNATPAWSRLAAGAEGQIMEMGPVLPGWGRKITISASDPSGGSDGDIWMKY